MFLSLLWIFKDFWLIFTTLLFSLVIVELQTNPSDKIVFFCRMGFSCRTLALPTFLVCFVITILSVFLSSFESFVVDDVELVKLVNSPPLAKRVVFITIDGLGAHILKETKHNYAKFLTWVLLLFGSYLLWYSYIIMPKICFFSLLFCWVL